MFFALAQSMMLRATILIDSWNWLGVFCAWFQYIMLYSFTLFMAQAGPYNTTSPPASVCKSNLAARLTG